MDQDPVGETTADCVLNSQALSRSRGISKGYFPKTYWVTGNWTAWVMATVGCFAVLLPKIVVPVLYGEEPFSNKIWGGGYMWFFACYATICIYVLTCRIPSALEREKDAIIVHFVLRKLKIPIQEIEEIRIVRKWMVKDSAKLVARSAPSYCDACIPSRLRYDEVNVSKQAAKRACPFCLCEPPDSDTKYFWGAPAMWGREVCILSVWNTFCNNYVFDLKNGETFIKDNEADFSNMTPDTSPARIGAPALPEDAGMLAPGAFSPMDKPASPLTVHASPPTPARLSTDSTNSKTPFGLNRLEESNRE